MALRNEIFAVDGEQEKIAFKISGQKDAEGNLLDERKTESLDQFREFFTQKVIYELPKDSLDNDSLMIKTKPLYSKEQKMLGKGADYKYWMNTPLKKVTQ